MNSEITLYFVITGGRSSAYLSGTGLKVLDGLGKVMIEKGFWSKELNPDLRSFFQGIYLLEVTRSDKVK